MDLSNAQTSNIFSFATEQGRTIVQLHYIDLIICFAIAFTVIGLLTYVIFKFRSRPGDKEPKQDAGNVKYEIIWTVIPALILLFLGILTALVMNRVNPPVLNKKPDVIVIGHQFWWEYRYPKTGVVTANELYLPVGVDSLLEMRSADVIHSFWVPNFGQKMDAIPGHPNNIFFKPLTEGVYTGACSEFCGADHSLMRILVNVVPQKKFDQWTSQELKVPAQPTDKTAEHGKELFMSKTCMQCHNIEGTDAKAHIAPDLTHLSHRQTIGSALLPNNTENVTNWIMNPQQFKPGCLMPKMRLSKADAHDIAVYLEKLE
jgi:cytochrome c oxidase subunit 2